MTRNQFPQTSYKRRLLLILALACCMAGKSRAQSPSSKEFNIRLDSFITDLMQKVPVIPAITVTMVNENGTVFNKAYGYANKEAGIKADLNTSFYIASSTKSFTALAAALLDQEKKIYLDSPLTQYFKNLKFNNEIGKDVTVRSLLNHTSGLENGPLTFRLAYSGLADDKEATRILAEATKVRVAPGVYKYDNLGYNIYTIASQAKLHKKWQDLLQEKVFAPLGMNRTTAYISQAKKNKWTIAAPYFAYGQEGLTKLYLEKDDNTMQSAGGLISTPNDIALWLQAWINNGKVNGRQVFPEQVMKNAYASGAKFERGNGLFPAGGHYGLGWSVSTYRGKEVVYHFGGFPGYRAHISFMPEKKTGLAIFVNEGSIGGAASDVIASMIYSWVTGNEGPEQAITIDQLVALHQRETEGSQKAYADRAKRVSQLSLPLTAYTGTYAHPLYGQIEVKEENNVLAVKMGNLRAVSTAFTKPETVRVELIPGSGQVIGFKVNENKTVTALNYDGLEFVRIR